MPIISRVIGSEGYGILAGLMAFTMLVSTILSFGTNTSLQVFYHKVDKKADKNMQFWSLVQVAAVSSLGVALLVFFMPSITKSLFLSANTDLFLVQLASCIIILTPVQLLFYSQMVNNQQGELYARLVLFITLIEVFITVFAALKYSIAGVYFAQVFTLSMQVFLTGKLVLKENPFMLLKRKQIRITMRYYRYGFFLFLSGLAAWIIDSSDRIILSKFVAVSDLGIYHVAYTISANLVNELAYPLYAVLLPALTLNIASGNRPEAVSIILKSQRYLILVYGLIVPLLSWVSYDILFFFTTPAFITGTRYIPWVAAGIACFQIFGTYHYNLHAHERGQWILLSTAVAAVVNIGMNLLLIPKYGVIAAAWSTFSAYLVNFFIIRYISNKFLYVPLNYTLLLRVVFAVLIMSLFVWLNQRIFSASLFRLLWCALSGVAVYVATLRLIGEIKKEDFFYLNQIWNKMRANNG